MMKTFEQHWVHEAATTQDNELPSLLSRAAKRVLDVDGAGLCLQTAPGSRLPLGASDEASATAERLQFTIGEGPCFEAMTHGLPVPVTESTMRQCWPVLAVLHTEVTPFRGGLAVPLHAGGATFGALDLYLTQPRPLQGADVFAAQAIAQSITDVLLNTLDVNALEAGDESDLSDSPAAWMQTPAVRRRREVWVAVGMANLTLGLRHDDALDTLRAHAVVRGQSLDDFAHDVVFVYIDLVELQ